VGRDLTDRTGYSRDGARRRGHGERVMAIIVMLTVAPVLLELAIVAVVWRW
jgi:hypothetical protein